ncbi:MAG: hypothetical protein ABSE39_10650 [Candidatus Bathyarchaeia archaeon]
MQSSIEEEFWQPEALQRLGLDAKIRIDVTNGFAPEELQAYGKVVRAGNLLRILTDEAKAQEISSEALKRKAAISISPVSLDDVFVELVGSDIDRDLPANNTAETVKGGSIYER